MILNPTPKISID